MTHPVEMNRPAPPLSYDTTAKPHHKWLRRGLIIAAVLIAGAFGSVWVRPLWNQSRLLYWQHRCATHTPTGQQHPNDWVQYSQLVSPPGIRSGGTLFVGELTSPIGHRRIVAVDLDPHPFISERNISPSFVTSTRVIEPAQWPLTPPLIHDSFGSQDRSRYLAIEVGATRTLPSDRGRKDVVDHSHFQIDLGDQYGLIDGWLLDNDTVRLEQKQRH